MDKAEQYLNYAIQFTPQYGDSFIEMLRVYLLKGQFHRISELKKSCVNADPNYGMLWFYCKNNSLDGPKEVWKIAKALMKNQICSIKGVYDDPANKTEWADCMWTGLCEANWSYLRNKSLSFIARSKLIYGSESLIL